MAKPSKTAFKPAAAGKKPVAPAIQQPVASKPTVVTAAPAAGIRPAARVEVKPAAGEITNQAIAEAAYYLWLQRGGNETVNWLEAESMLRRHAAKR